MARDGTKTGGRQKGSKNKKKLALDELAVKLNKTPLEVMLNAMDHFDRNGEHHAAADIAAKAAPYIHKKMPSELNVKNQGTLTVDYTPILLNAGIKPRQEKKP